MSGTSYSSSSSYPDGFDTFSKDASSEVETFNSSMRWAIASSIGKQLTNCCISFMFSYFEKLGVGAIVLMMISSIFFQF